MSDTDDVEEVTMGRDDLVTAGFSTVDLTQVPLCSVTVGTGSAVSMPPTGRQSGHVLPIDVRTPRGVVRYCVRSTDLTEAEKLLPTASEAFPCSTATILAPMTVPESVLQRAFSAGTSQQDPQKWRSYSMGPAIDHSTSYRHTGQADTAQNTESPGQVFNPVDGHTNTDLGSTESGGHSDVESRNNHASSDQVTKASTGTTASSKQPVPSLPTKGSRSAI